MLRIPPAGILVACLLLATTFGAIAQPPIPPKVVGMPDKSASQEISRASRAARKAESDGKWAEALDLWQTVLQAKPGDLLPYDGVRRCLVALNRFDDALRFLDRMDSIARRGTVPLDPLTVAVDRVEVLLSAQRDNDAAAMMDDALRQYRGNPTVYMQMAQVLYAQRRGDDAATLLLRGRRECNDPFLFAREIANYAEARMDYKTAVDEYLNDLEGDPDGIGYVKSALGDIASSPGGDSVVVAGISSRLQAKATSNFTGVLRQLLAAIHFRAKRYSEALEEYKELDRTGEPGQELIIFARMLYSEGEYRLAWDAYNQIIGASGAVAGAEALLGKGQAAEMLGALDTARTAFLSLLGARLTPDMAYEAYRRLGDIELDHGDPSKAHDRYESALKIGDKMKLPPDRLDSVRVSDAVAYARSGDDARAQIGLKKVIGDKPNRSAPASRARLEMARIAFRSGDIQNAGNYATALTMADPASEYANDALELLSLLTDLKSDSSALLALGRADREAYLGHRDAAILILDSLSHCSGQVSEEALWRTCRLEIERERYREALAAVERIIASGNGGLRMDLALWTAAQLCEVNLKQNAKAAQLYERLLTDYPESPFADRARKRLKEITTEL